MSKLFHKEDLKLYLVTDRFDFSDAEFLERIESALKAGVTMVQLREKTASTREFYTLGQQVKQLTDKYHVSLVIDDRIDLCLALDADGVHIGDDELPVAVTRQLVGPDKIVGVSVKSVEQAEQAASDGADYFGIGAIFPTATKADADDVSKTTLTAINASTAIPSVAIGGVKDDNALELADTGIAGVAIISDIMLADDVTAKVQSLDQKLDTLLKGAN